MSARIVVGWIDGYACIGAGLELGQGHMFDQLNNRLLRLKRCSIELWTQERSIYKSTRQESRAGRETQGSHSGFSGWSKVEWR